MTVKFAPALLVLCLGFASPLLHAEPAAAEQTAAAGEPASGFTREEVLTRAEGFFGDVTEGLATAVELAFADQGQPNAVIIGDEVSAALGIGARYGRGKLETRDGTTQDLYWQGPSIGLDTGGNASKVMALIYDLEDVESIFQRYPGVDGSLYVFAGASVNYLRNDKVIIAPIRTGVGARAGVSVGYLHFTREKSWIPF